MRTIKDWLRNDSHSICVGYSSEKGFYTIYNAETETSNDVPESVLVDGILRRGAASTILNLRLDHDGKVQTTLAPKEDMECYSMIAVGIVNSTRKVKDIIGYDMVLNTGVKVFIDMKRAVDYAFSGFVHNMTAESREDKKPTYKQNGKLLYVRYAEDEQSDDEKQKRLEELKGQLIRVLTQMDAIRPVQFHDIDCDDCVYNFSDVVIDKAEDRIYIEIAMWHDNLPAHAEHPLKDGRGREILPQKKGNHKYVVALATGGLQEDPEICYSKFEVIDASCEQDACAIYNAKHNCSFFYGSVIGEVVDGKVQYSEGLHGKLDMQDVNEAVANAT